MKLVVLTGVCVVCGVVAGMLLRGAAFGAPSIDRQEQLARGSVAVKAASSVLMAVRWHGDDTTISRASCGLPKSGQWRCTVTFRSGDGDELEGPGAPRVSVRFSGSAVRPQLRACVLSDPQMGRAVDCTTRARAAIRR